METLTFTDPVAQLLTLGMNNEMMFSWPKYLEMGFTAEHIPELIRLVQDFELANLLPDDEGNEPAAVYGQLHAWRTLTQLQSTEAIPAFIALLRNFDEYGDDYISSEIPRALGIFGEAALNPSYELLCDNSIGTSPRIHAASAIAQIGKNHPKLRKACVAMLINALSEYKQNSKGVNSFIILSLADLKSQEACLLVEKVIREGYSDISFSGNYNCYKWSIGLLPK
jgi:hypothetical protein